MTSGPDPVNQKHNSMNTFVSDISGKKFPVVERVSGEAVRDSIMNLIRQDHPDFDRTKILSIKELNVYRERYISDYLKREVGSLSQLDSQVLDAINEKSIVTDNAEDDKATVGQKVADKVASFGGSWTFIIIFVVFILVWMGLNVFFLLNRGYDPYPFILLNLILSCLAALQAPVIMMSQNRQGDKDRKRAENDYMVNLKSEIELRSLHEKVDHLMIYQQQDLIETQKIQIDMLTDIIRQLDRKISEKDKSMGPSAK